MAKNTTVQKKHVKNASGRTYLVYLAYCIAVVLVYFAYFLADSKYGALIRAVLK